MIKKNTIYSFLKRKKDEAVNETDSSTSAPTENSSPSLLQLEEQI